MNLKTILGFLVGRADAIRSVAASKSAFWTGLVLVLLTAFPRNYDQTYIPEKPVLWFLGPLLFSIVSGTWLFLVSYGFCARWKMDYADGKKPPLWPTWRGFMGAFWMTAPIAWIYAIPVERFWDSLAATKANLWLLAIVSLWRVLLMARVFHVICRAPAFRCLLWVLLPAGVEVVLLGLSNLSDKIMRSMGGMRNSPEETMILKSLSVVSDLALWTIPAVIVVLAVWRWNGTAQTWPVPKPDRFPWVVPLVALLGWSAVLVPAQIELARNYTVEQLIATGDMRAALDFMNRHEPDDFAPARPLPPKLYETTVFQELFPLAGALTAADKVWVRQHIGSGLPVATGHLAWWWKGDPALEEVEPERFKNGLFRYPVSAADLISIFSSTNPAPEVTEWLKRYPNFIQGIALYAADTSAYSWSEEQQRADWARLAETLGQLGYAGSTTNQSTTPMP
jgi:hypothetical protein